MQLSHVVEMPYLHEESQFFLWPQKFQAKIHLLSLILYILNLSNLEEFFNSLITTWVTTPQRSTILVFVRLCPM